MSPPEEEALSEEDEDSSEGEAFAPEGEDGEDEEADSGPAGVLVAKGLEVSAEEFEPVRRLLAKLLADEDYSFRRRLGAACCAVDLLWHYVPVALGNGSAPDSAGALKLFLEEVEATEADRLWDFACKGKPLSPMAGKIAMTAIAKGLGEPKTSKGQTKSAVGLLALTVAAGMGTARLRFDPFERRMSVRRLLSNRLDLDSPVLAERLGSYFAGDILAKGDWTEWDEAARWAFRRVVLLYGLIGWRAATLAGPGVSPEEALAQAIEFADEHFARPEAPWPAFRRWPVFEISFAQWINHTAFPATTLSLATAPRE